MSEQPIIINATAYWAFLTNKNQYGDFSIDLCNLSDAAVSKLQSVGLKIASKDDKPEQGNYLSCKSKHAIRFYGTGGEEMTDMVQVGNGSKVKAVVSPYDWTFAGKSGKSASIYKLVITDLIPFEGAGGVGDVDLDEAL